MATRDPSQHMSFPQSQSRPQHSAAYVDPTAETFALTDSQKEILALLEDRPAVASEAFSVLDPPPRGFGLDVAFATAGAASMALGVVLVFFFAALGAVFLLLGAICCAVAFEHVALRGDEGGQAELHDGPAGLADEVSEASR